MSSKKHSLYYCQWSVKPEVKAYSSTGNALLIWILLCLMQRGRNLHVECEWKMFPSYRLVLLVLHAFSCKQNTNSETSFSSPKMCKLFIPWVWESVTAKLIKHHSYHRWINRTQIVNTLEVTILTILNALTHEWITSLLYNITKTKSRRL